MSKYWITPPDLYERLDAEFHFDFDPCPYPRGRNTLLMRARKSGTPALFGGLKQILANRARAVTDRSFLFYEG